MLPVLRRKRGRLVDPSVLENLVENDEDGWVLSDRAGVVVYANPAYLRMAAADAPGLVPGVERLFCAETAAPALFRLARAARSGRRLQEVVPHSAGDGRPEWWRIAVRPAGDGSELAVWRVSRSSRDEAVSPPEPGGTPATEQEGVGPSAPAGTAPDPAIQESSIPEADAGPAAAAAEAERPPNAIGGPAGPEDAALQRAGERFARFFDNAPVGILIVRADGTIESANAAIRAMVSPPPGPNGRLLDTIAEEDRAEVAARIREAAEGRPARPLVEVRLSGSGERVAQLYVSRIEAAPAPSVVLYFIDTTEQKNLELQFAQSQKMQAVGQLAGGIAHDFNNLLTAILGFCDLLLVRHRPGDPSFGDVMQIKQNANRAANLVRQLLAFSRKQTLRPKVLVLTDELSELSSLLRRLLGEKIELRVLHGRNLHAVRVDQGQLEQVIINLAVNARDAMPDGGMLTIKTANVSTAESRKLGHSLMPAADYVMIEVSDTGTGIPKENLGKIFEPFFTTKEVGKGTGLGLSTVYGIVKQTGGFIFPESEPGRGATFRIYLPRHESAESPAPAEAEERETPSDLTGKGTILLVEDEDAVRAFAVRALSNRGYTVLEASDGAKGLDVVREHSGPIDLVITDVVMPNMDGPALLQEIRAIRPDVRIVFISGYAEEAFRRSMQRDEGFTFLPKPFSLKQLASTVKEVLSQE